MKPHKIIKTFKGTQDGRHDSHTFAEGDVAHLSDGLAAIVVREGWAEPVDTESGIPALVRETKIVGPEETKVVSPESTKSTDDMDFKELQALAKTKGIKTFGMSQEKLLTALKAA